MSAIGNQPVDEMTHEALAEEYSEIGDELFFGGLPDDDERDDLYDRRMELWQEMKSRVEVTLPDCPECGDDRWSQTPGDPKQCSGCGFEPRRSDLIEDINEAWRTILNE